MNLIKKKLAVLAAAAAALSSCGSQVGKVDHSTESSQTPTQAETSAPDESSQEAAPTEAKGEESSPEKSSGKASVRGKMYDCDGRLLMYSQDGRRYVSEEFAYPFANVLTEMSAGLDGTFNDLLTEKNPTPVDGSDDVGQGIQVTFDAQVQKAVYDYMQSMNIVGSAVVMRTDGSLMAEVSYPSYDPNTYTDTKYDEELAWGECGNKAFQNFEPGSCFKIMSEVISDKHGVTSQTDPGIWEFGDFPITNWDYERNASSYPMERSLYSAFVNSSNIYFAKSFDQIGAEDVLSDLKTIFHFGGDEEDDIHCDFGSLENNIEIYCDDDLRRSAFGQSYVLTCPIFLAALGREAVFGDMVKPFVLENVVDSNDCSSVIAPGTAHSEVIASIPAEYRQGLLDGMTGVASGLSVSVPAGHTLYAKTGTAETWIGDVLYITGCVKNDSDSGTTVYTDYSDYGQTGSYVIVMQIQNPAAHGFSFASESARVYDGIVNAVVNNV